MNTTPSIKPEELRADAESRLRQRSAPPSSGWTINPETLELLYRLSSNPDSASDAKKLLHELQTHQVELDLQHAQMLENDHQLNSQLTHYQALFEQAPAGYLILDRNYGIQRFNRAAIELLGMDSEQLDGQLLSSLLDPRSMTSLVTLLETPNAERGGQTIRVQSINEQRLRLMVSSASFEEVVLVMLFPDESVELI